MKKTGPFLITLSLIISPNLMNAQEKPNYPETKTIDHVDNYFGTEVHDPYQWLEYDTATDVKAWVDQENEVTHHYLNEIPFRNALRQRMEKLMDYTKYSAPSQDGEWLTYYKNTGLQNQAILYVQKGTAGIPSVLLDPNKLSSEGTAAIQATTFSKNQKYFAYSISKAGSDWQKIYVLDFKTKQLLPDSLDHIKFTGIEWVGDKGFYYSGFEAPKDEALRFSNKTEFQKVYFHKIGTPQSQDILIYEDKEHPLRYVSAQLTEDERYLVLNISEGTDGSEIKVKDLKQANSAWKTLVPGFSTNAYVVTDKGNNLLLYTNQDAPNYKLVEVNPDHPQPHNWKIIIPESTNKLESVSTCGGYLFAGYLKDVCSEVFQMNMEGKEAHLIQLPGKGTAAGFGAHQKDKSLYYSYTSYNYPASIFRYDLKTHQSVIWHTSEVDFNPEDYVTEQVFYPSKDGTRVPMFITYKKGMKKDGNNPVMIYAYGGFNISITPAFNVTNIPFLENGGIYCVANIRGGGEYGEKWHRAGMFEKKQTVFNDFIAAAEYLIQENYTNPKKISIRGGSNGGLLIGAVMTQRPDLYAVAIPQVGVMDMLKFQKFTVGWGWVSEYGSSDKKDQFDYLIKYSPLQNLKKGVCYPATLVTTADHDDRVVPAHSFKFAATLQADQGCDHPTLIRIDHNAGHGAGKPISKIIDEQTDIWSFVMQNLGMDFTDK